MLGIWLVVGCIIKLQYKLQTVLMVCTKLGIVQEGSKESWLGAVGTVSTAMYRVRLGDLCGFNQCLLSALYWFLCVVVYSSSISDEGS